MLIALVFIVFFFKQKTAYEMRISDWSSDVCSSDLHDGGDVEPAAEGSLQGRAQPRAFPALHRARRGTARCDGAERSDRLPPRPAGRRRTLVRSGRRCGDRRAVGRLLPPHRLSARGPRACTEPRPRRRWWTAAACAAGIERRRGLLVKRSDERGGGE